jgi:VanZ family protein
LTRPSWPVLRRAAFLLYIPVLFTATHWPRLTIPGEGRKDLIVHVAALGFWTALLIGAGFFGPPLSRRNIFAAFGIATLYAVFDEATQAIPFIHRTAALDDWAADCAGIFLACVVALLVRALARRSVSRRAVAEPGPTEPIIR